MKQDSFMKQDCTPCEVDSTERSADVQTQRVARNADTRVGWNFGRRVNLVGEQSTLALLIVFSFSSVVIPDLNS